MRNVYKILVTKPLKTDHLENFGSDWRMILKCILKAAYSAQMVNSSPVCHLWQLTKMSRDTHNFDVGCNQY
jgi:hypothetical protein